MFAMVCNLKLLKTLAVLPPRPTAACLLLYNIFPDLSFLTVVTPHIKRLTGALE